ncbi:ABC transporter ATP-binding protein [Sandarakinorhabdus limnophila]|uniref:ABC transporter ATP-binding protein n=1 Tax=Sandarakinorhabdus limnophila TaxID=210512 RepID=UPI0026F0EE48|nr:ABC transporter ATP-binding protein [Sandarakinorhabdus limnophila]MCM0033127.1 ABC transporter ATP-binding protein [Sandarakinorhabdus limnophila]
MRPDTPSAGPAVVASVLAATGLARAVPLAGGGRRSLFSGVNIALAPGEVVAITGESGVGKSTLLNVIAGLDAADAGEVLIGGRNVAALAEPERAKLRASALGFVFQAFHVLPHLSLARNVALPCLLAGMNAADALARAETVLADVGLVGRGGDWPAVLSGGELQRVAIARALVHRPGLVLADEPTGNLDPETAGRILDLLLSEARDRRAAVLIVSHSEMVAAAADRVLRLSASGLVPA